ncbi:uncharacterized protein M421DRAFT_101824 [Didymella exigua CBS 183.55]|uniref:DNA/RNA-binding domain-containing protein n=1 Tax=Didymella exigua CBS 183.55 TaxID=1150837 RepID=A0A6A5RJI4_9PLEO|nr:uncharacterized protein M421DRAFT_101824 [Didymella exigua CBS 183.55]KAF1927420.1 hypothetical protein M421DRAFT_101824 [Didymella exigua CBS 183.55]
MVDIQSRFVNSLRTQASNKTESRTVGSLPCPYGHPGRTFQSVEQLYNHAKAEHAPEIEGLEEIQAKIEVRNAALKLRQSGSPFEAISGGNTAPDIAALSLEAGKKRQTSPSSGKKRRAESEIGAHPDYSRDISYTMQPSKPRSKPLDARLYNPTQGTKCIASSCRSTTGRSSDRSADVRHAHARQKDDPRYPGFLLQPDSRPISQEQLASEVKSIYAGLTMVETKCIHVDREQAAAPQGPNQKLAPDHWQALIALHRTLLHEHHDFFLASQHPSASPALRRLAGKYTMPARMWKHGIHSFLELLRQKLPHSLDYMLAFIYLAYQMMALLYETVPAFEDTWIECLGDLGRYRMAIEDEDIRDREIWAGVARSWYSRAADKNPTVGRLYHHLAILARPNALQQMYYYSRSLASVETFPSARESIMTLLGPVLRPDPPGYSIPSPVDASFVTAHAHIFTRNVVDKYGAAQAEYLSQLDNHIGRVTAKWKEQGVYTAIINSAAWLDYGAETNTIRLILELRARERRQSHLTEDQIMAELALQKDKPKITESEIPSTVEALSTDMAFCEAVNLANRTLSVALRRIGDKNVLPHVHVMLAFLSVLASIEYVADLIEQAPWADLVPFLNTLVKMETQQSQAQDFDALFAQPTFAVGKEGKDDHAELPLPEDYLIRGLVWGEEYFPSKYFEKEHDEEERYLELASTAKCRTERVLRLGAQLSSFNRWISYNEIAHTFSTLQPRTAKSL